MRFAHLAQRLFNTPLALHPDKAEIVMAALAERLGIASMVRFAGDPLALSPLDFGDDWAPASPKGYDLNEGVACIDVRGTLVQKLGTLRPYSGMTGYDGIRQNVMEAAADPEARAIMLNVDSPGGEVAGCFDVVDLIYQAREEKPIWAILDETAFSAGYAIASAADRVIVPRTGFTGSIGVIVMHVDISQALSKEGINVTLITHGDQKADGARFKPLPDGAKARIQGTIDAMGEIFDQTVARNRGLSAETVRNMQAGTFFGPDGVAAGLADAVMPPDQAFLALLDSLS